MKVLAVGAHPDDCEILCGGTLARFVQQGDRVVMAHLTNGDKGHYEMDSAKLAKVRRAEALKAAEVIGAEAIDLGLPDAMLFSNDQTRMLVIDLVRRVKPDLVITMSPRDYSSDHTATSTLVCDAASLASAPLVKTKLPHTEGTPPIYFCDTVFGIGSDVSIYVDITDTFETKVKMLRCHQSQLAWLKEHNNRDIVEDIECVARFRGLQCGVKYAEAFSEYSVWPIKVPKRLLP